MADVKGVLARVADGAEPAAASGQGAVVTARVLHGLAESWGSPLSASQRSDLEALARKVHVAKKMMASYGAGWKKTQDSEELATECWPLLIAVFLAHADPGSEVGDDRGLALKNLNAGLEAIDRAARLGVTDAELEAWAQALVNSATEARP
jgi:hypothetical protein